MIPDKTVCVLRYGNTNTYFIRGSNQGILVDTDWAGTMPGFYGALKAHHLRLKDISYVFATHYHPDHMGLISELMDQGTQLLLFDVQKETIHFSDSIFAKEKRLHYKPIDEKKAVTISCHASRDFLRNLGISGEVIHTPGHSDDSVSLLLDSGAAIVGDLDPLPYMDAYPPEDTRQDSWRKILSHHPSQIFYAHANPQMLDL